MRNWFSSGLFWCLVAGAGQGFAQITVPEECGDFQNSELTKVSVISGLNNPMEVAVTPEGNFFIIEKNSGDIRYFNYDAISTAGHVDVYTPAHAGLIGLAVDPDFGNNRFVYVYYTHETEARHELARFTESNGTLTNKIVMLEVPGVGWNDQHHSAGCLQFDTEGNLYISTGENVNPKVSDGYASVNEADRLEDTQATSANTNDLNGKVLRIHPEPDGSYTIPEGNLFAASSQTREEIYTMGMRNPFRIAIDPLTGWLYWGEPGPDADNDGAAGPGGRDEINQVKAAGFYGWPYFIADNQAYNVNGETKNAAAPTNNSPNNSGLTTLPAAQPSFIDYRDAAHPQWSALGSGARASILGGIYRYNPNLDTETRLPPHFEGSLFIMDWARNWIKEVKMGAAGNLEDIVNFMPGTNFTQPIDMEFAPDGNMYILEYGSGTLFRIEYSGDCQMDPVGVLPGIYAGAQKSAQRIFKTRGKMEISVPAGVRSVNVFGLDGTLKAEVTDIRFADGQGVATLPEALGEGVVLVKAMF